MTRRRTALVTALSTAVAAGAVLAPSASAMTYEGTKEYRGATVKLTVTTRDDGTARLRTTNNLPVRCGSAGRIKFKMDVVVTPNPDGTFDAKDTVNINLKIPGKGKARERYTGSITADQVKLRFRTKIDGARHDCSADVRWTATPAA